MSTNSAILILPTHLFEENNLINSNSTVYIYEHPVYFTMYPYHKLKLILHRASMKYYYNYLSEKYKCIVKYINQDENIDIIFNKHANINMYDPMDFSVTKSLKKYANKITMYDSPNFITSSKDLKDYGIKLNQTAFYKWQRKRFNILIDGKGNPIGGKWTYDTENRNPFPKDYDLDMKIKINQDIYVIDAIKYVNKHFNNNIGSTDFYLPVNFSEAKLHFKVFLKNRLSDFGKYQDAVSEKIVVGNHSLLSPLLNIGLLTPKYVIEKALSYYKKNKISIETIEAFIRQILGWREYMRYVYIFKHKELISLNHFNHKNNLSNIWFTAKTDIKPIDDIILKSIRYGYAHHIERLMYIGNFMLLTQIHPKKIHDWFMIMFVDSYHVFMEPNVYGMSQYSAGKIMSTRPYFSSSNYIDKMSTYKKKYDTYKKIQLNKDDYEWFEVFDALYYNFINNNIGEFSKNYATASSVSHWKRKTLKEKKNYIKIANDYLSKY